MANVFLYGRKVIVNTADLTLPNSQLLHLFRRLFGVLATCWLVSACVPKPVPEPEPLPEPEPIVEVLSSEPITSPSKDEIFFAQTALTRLGFDLGKIDGWWGNRSKSAMKLFESANDIASAQGFLSEANMDKLASLSKLSVVSVAAARVKRSVAKKPKGIRAKLVGKLLDTGPQLIIVERNYKVFSQPNPYSEVNIKLQDGTGVYVLNDENGWFEVETLARVKGYIAAD